MKLKDKDMQSATAGLPASYREWWDIGDGYEIYINISHEVCSLGIDAPGAKDITYEIAALLGVDTSEGNLIKRNNSKEDLYLSMGIDCVVLNYRKPESYMELLKRIESLVNKNIKHK